jgi:uncharacterized protein with NAD-binding domain and iron-sulfur cluster
VTQQKIAIVGGGMAALSAAFELTRTKELQERYDVTIYQMGWRLGGKAATGRDNQGRAVEHGLHIWFGCYENAFKLLRSSYDEWDQPSGQAIGTWEEALRPQRNTAIGAGDGSEIICLGWPVAPGNPGEGDADLSLWACLFQMLDVISCFYMQLKGGSFAPPEIPLGIDILILLMLADVDLPFPIPPVPVAIDEPQLESFAISAEEAVLLSRNWAKTLREKPLFRNDAQMRGFVSFIRGYAKKLVRSQEFMQPPGGRFLAHLIDIGTAVIKGVVIDMLLGAATIADLDLMDFREWLTLCGAERDSVYGSHIVEALYDSLLQYSEGDSRRPSYGAGIATQAVLRLYGTYRNAFAFEMQAGMGEIVVAPIYEVLKQRNVKFQFFHKLTRIELTAGKDAVSRLHFDKQVCLLQECYEPTLPPRPANGNLECWPDAPLWDQIKDGDKLAYDGVDFESHWCRQNVGEVALQQGCDFDDVVLAIPLGAFKQLNEAPGPCAELIAASDRFRAMTETATLIPSISFQAWCNRDAGELGWPPRDAVVPSEGEGKAAISTGPGPLDIWADMSQVLKYEHWRPYPEGPKSLQYLCGVLETQLYREPPDSDINVQLEANALARKLTIQWLNEKAHYVWPDAIIDGHFDWSVLFETGGCEGCARIDSQVVRANVDPSSCCVGSAAGSTQWRLKTDGAGFRHLYMAGAWIDSGFNTECIETAVMSGMQAARAIATTELTIPGDDFLQFGDDFALFFALAAQGVTSLFEIAAGALSASGEAEIARRRAWLRQHNRMVEP